MAAALGIGRDRLMLDDRRTARRPRPSSTLSSAGAKGEPIAYITGHRAFWTIDLEVGPGALVPRPDSETLIAAAVEHFAGTAGPKRILDLGTGPGTLLLAALDEWPKATGLGVDASEAALDYAARNADRLGIDRPRRVPDRRLGRGDRRTVRPDPVQPALCRGGRRARRRASPNMSRRSAVRRRRRGSTIIAGWRPRSAGCSRPADWRRSKSASIRPMPSADLLAAQGLAARARPRPRRTAARPADLRLVVENRLEFVRSAITSCVRDGAASRKSMRPRHRPPTTSPHALRNLRVDGTGRVSLRLGAGRPAARGKTYLRRKDLRRSVAGASATGKHSLINNRQGGRRRGRGGQRPQGMSGSRGGNRQDNRQRGNAAQLLEKYKSMARDAQLAGDRVQTEYYLQYADHYFRVLGESRSRFEDQRRAPRRGRATATTTRTPRCSRMRTAALRVASRILRRANPKQTNARSAARRAAVTATSGSSRASGKSVATGALATTNATTRAASASRSTSCRRRSAPRKSVRHRTRLRMTRPRGPSRRTRRPRADDSDTEIAPAA